MRRKASLLYISIFILLFCVVFAGNTHAATAATNTASGTYTYTSVTGELVLNFTSSDFECDEGPDLGQETWTVTSLTATTMIWVEDENIMTWTRNGGTPGDHLGAWMTEKDSNTYEITFNSNGTLNVTGTIVECSNGTGTRNASGTYTYTSATGLLEWNWTSSNFTCDGPEIEQGTDTVTLLTETTMIWAGEHSLTWTRPAGTASDIIGTWTATDSSTGNSYELTLNSDGTVTLVGNIVECHNEEDSTYYHLIISGNANGYVEFVRSSSELWRRSGSVTRVDGGQYSGSAAIVAHATGSLPLKYLPPHVGQTWTATGRSNVYQVDSHAEVVNVSENVLVTAGTFNNCAKVDTDLSYPSGYTPGQRYPVKFERWFCPGIGPTKLIITIDDGTQYSGELTSYQNITSDPNDYFPLGLGYTWTFKMNNDEGYTTWSVDIATVLTDIDDDGFTAEVDCDDEDPSINPRATDTWYDGIDQNCDGANDYDQDGDGIECDGAVDPACAGHVGTDCNDTDTSINPVAVEIWYDGIDQNCDGANDYDQDSDGIECDGAVDPACAGHVGTDCNDADSESYPGSSEVCDGLDNDCNTLIDDNPVDAGAQCSAGTGVCEAEGTEQCIAGSLSCDAVPGQPVAEICDGLDNNCDGSIDNAGVPNNTSNIAISANLDARETAGVPFAIANPTGTSNYLTSISVYDSLGIDHNLAIYFTKTAANVWTWNAVATASEVTSTSESGTNALIASGQLTFTSNGELDIEGAITYYNATTTGIDFTGAAVDQAITFDYGTSITTDGGTGLDSTTQFGSASTVYLLTQDGYGSGDACPIEQPEICMGVAVGSYHTCVLKTDGNVDCYGNDSYGQSVDYTAGDAVGMSANDYHTCVLKANGNVDCYGNNGNGQAEDYAGGDAVGVSAGDYYTCVLKTDGNVDCYGYDYNGEAEDYTGGDAVGVSAATHHTCVLKTDGNVDCYGDNYYGQSEDYTGGYAVGVSTGYSHTCVLKTDGNVDCYGHNNFGQSEDYTGGDAVGVSASNYRTCVLKADGNVDCYGYNYYGQSEDYTGEDAVGVSTGYYHTCVLKTDGNVDCYGRNDYGQSEDYTGGDATCGRTSVAIDGDGDGIPDGDGTNLCTGGNNVDCDDNCPDTPNADQTDADSDGAGDVCDNCSATPNPDQQNTDDDGYGNICDADLDNDGAVGFQDFIIFKAAWLATYSSGNWNPDADFDSDGSVGFQDFIIFKGRWLTTGPWD